MFEAPSHWLILALVMMALFGYKKLPDAARSLGRSLRIFKTEIKGMGEDDHAREAARQPSDTTISPAVAAAPQTDSARSANGAGGSIVSSDKATTPTEVLPITGHAGKPAAPHQL